MGVGIKVINSYAFVKIIYACAPHTKLCCGNIGNKQKLPMNNKTLSFPNLGRENGVAWSALKICHYPVTLMLRFKPKFV